MPKRKNLNINKNSNFDEEQIKNLTHKYKTITGTKTTAKILWEIMIKPTANENKTYLPDSKANKTSIKKDIANTSPIEPLTYKSKNQ